MKRFVIAIVVVLAVAGLWTGGWFYVASQIEAEVEHLAQADGFSAPRLTCRQFAVSGFPFQFAPRCTGAEVLSGDIAVDLAEIHATALFYRPNHVQIFATGPARISDAFTGSVQEVEWSNFHASLRLEGGRLARLSAIAEDLVHADALFGRQVLATAQRAETHLLDATPSDAPETAGQVLDFFLRLDAVESPGFEIADGKLTVDGQVSGVPDPALWGHPELLRLWQLGDGVLTLRGLEGAAEGLSLSASGEAHLDDGGQVNGRLALASQGIVERLGELKDDPLAAMFIGAPDAEGRYSQSISVRSGTVIVGILPLMALEPLF